MILAIKGHATRGKEIIKLLELLGGRNNDNDCSACFVTRVYFINENNYIDYCDCMHHLDYFQLTLEEFEEKFPYKVGDKVQHRLATSCGSIYVIEQMKWEDNQVKYVICDLYWKNCKCTVISKDLQPYKEDTMEDKGDKAKAPNLIGEDYSGKRFGYKIPNGYEFDCIKNNEIILKPKHPKYPKTYEECCDILQLEHTFELKDLTMDEEKLIDSFIRLKRCRDAYWKIAGEEIKLDKPWEPDFTVNIFYPSIIVEYGEVVRRESRRRNVILVFPTSEMRDAFYENFKNLIKQCSKLL